MIVKLSDYIMEQEVSTASCDDIVCEQLQAEINVLTALTNACVKECMMFEYATVYQEEDEETTKKPSKIREFFGNIWEKICKIASAIATWFSTKFANIKAKFNEKRMKKAREKALQLEREGSPEEKAQLAAQIVTETGFVSTKYLTAGAKVFKDAIDEYLKFASGLRDLFEQWVDDIAREKMTADDSKKAIMDKLKETAEKAKEAVDKGKSVIDKFTKKSGETVGATHTEDQWKDLFEFLTNDNSELEADLDDITEKLKAIQSEIKVAKNKSDYIVASRKSKMSKENYEKWRAQNMEIASDTIRDEHPEIANTIVKELSKLNTSIVDVVGQYNSSLDKFVNSVTKNVIAIKERDLDRRKKGANDGVFTMNQGRAAQNEAAKRALNPDERDYSFVKY